MSGDDEYTIKHFQGETFGKRVGRVPSKGEIIELEQQDENGKIFGKKRYLVNEVITRLVGDQRTERTGVLQEKGIEVIVNEYRI